MANFETDPSYELEEYEATRIVDQDITLDHLEVMDDEGINPLEAAEMQAVQEEEFSEPSGLTGPQADWGFYDPETIDAVSVEKGAGARLDPEEVEDLGLHVEIPLPILDSDSISEPSYDDEIV